MDKEIAEKSKHLLENTRVMTLAVSNENIPWTAPVYFVFIDGRFCFFSNETSRHIRWAQDRRLIAASIFHDSDNISQIFGFQMSGVLEPVTGPVSYLKTVKSYVGKFGFLEKVFGPQIFENKDFFKDKFKSLLYAFVPEYIYLSDNSKSTGKRIEILLSDLDTL